MLEDDNLNYVNNYSSSQHRNEKAVPCIYTKRVVFFSTAFLVKETCLTCSFNIQSGFYFVFLGFPCGSADKKSNWNAGDLVFESWVGKIPWRRERLPTPVFWPGGFHGVQRGLKESDTTEWLSLSFFKEKKWIFKETFYIITI